MVATKRGGWGKKDLTSEGRSGLAYRVLAHSIPGGRCIRLEALYGVQGKGMAAWAEYRTHRKLVPRKTYLGRTRTGLR